jgi:hypothetical protein
MDYQMLFNIAMAVVGALGGWMVGRITRALDELDKDVRAMPHQYVSKVDYRSDIQDIKTGLERIYNRLDGKVDK